LSLDDSGNTCDVGDGSPSRKVGFGQIVVEPADPGSAPAEQVQPLYRLSDPALSELNLDELLDELLVRVRDALRVDTVAILLKEENPEQLVARAAKGLEEEVERGVRIPIGSGFAGRIAGERVAIFIADVDHADILNRGLREQGVRSLLEVAGMSITRDRRPAMTSGGGCPALARRIEPPSVSNTP
jgi:hypothetical protein